MIDGVELVLRHQPQQVGELHGQHAGRGEEDLQPRHEVVQVRHVGEDVVADQQVGPRPSADQFAGGRRAEERARWWECPPPGPPRPRCAPARCPARECPAPGTSAAGSRRCSRSRSPGGRGRSRSARSSPRRRPRRGAASSRSRRRSRRSRRRSPPGFSSSGSCTRKHSLADVDAERIERLGAGRGPPAPGRSWRAAGRRGPRRRAESGAPQKRQAKSRTAHQIFQGVSPRFHSSLRWR